MKKIFGALVAVALVAGVAMPGFAAKTHGKKASSEKFDRIVAEVVSIDVSARMIAVKEEKSGASRTVKVSARAVSKLAVGDRVRIKLKAGTDESAGVRVLKPEMKADAVGAMDSKEGLNVAAAADSRVEPMEKIEKR
jgi:hypothetical protein